MGSYGYNVPQLTHTHFDSGDDIMIEMLEGLELWPADLIAQDFDFGVKRKKILRSTRSSSRFKGNRRTLQS